MTLARYPLLIEASLAVLLHAAPGAAVTRELIEAATGDANAFEIVLADLTRAHFLDDCNELTPLADAYARMWRASMKL